ncbi:MULTISPECIES: CsbD family protein [unclassified Streptomyces]|uniref:CsbD family protein n=1 Tax=unclassified Streptomyces TaxID=2593676 RepID=UPI001655488E|nr:CsbD family protein [Streptomyces sp. CB02980]MCB8901742.1 CsbD family protein [Streptomyces sp. CB02980]
MRKSTVQKGKGTVKEAAGRATGNERLEAEGKADQMAAEARAAIERVHESAQKARDDMKRSSS